MLKYKDYSTLINEQQKEYESFTKDKLFFCFYRRTVQRRHEKIWVSS